MNAADQNTDSIRVLIAVPEQILRRGLLDCIDNLPEVEIVGTASTGKLVIERSVTLCPSVVVLSTNIKEPTFEQVCLQLRCHAPDSSALLLTLEERREIVLAAARCGARGLLGLSASKEDIVTAMRRIHSGQIRFTEEALLEIIDDYMHARSEAQSSQQAHPVSHHPSAPLAETPGCRLSKRERQVVALVAVGLTSRSIAEELNISIRTVEAHRARISDKLGIRTVVGLTQYALKTGITTLMP